MTLHYAKRGWRPLAALIVVVASVAIFCSAALADGAGGTEFRSGLRSMQFGIERDFQLGAFDGFLLSCKRHISPNSAYRLGLTLDASSQNNGRLPAKQFPGTQVQRRDSYSDYDGNWADIDVQLLYVRYMSPEKRIRPFWGLGPSIGYYRYDYERDGEIQDPYYTSADWDYTYTLTGGIAGVFGVEWFAWDGISFLAEYRAALTYTYWSEEYRLTNNSQNSSIRNISRQLSFESQAVMFGIAVYLNGMCRINKLMEL